METSLKTDAIEIFSQIWQGSAVREVTEDLVVPDSMEDAGVILDAAGILTMRGRETVQDAVELSASLSVCVVYAPENGDGLRSLDVSLPIEMRLDAPGADMDCRTACGVRVRSLEARMLNSRKLRVRAELEADAACYRRDCLRIASGLEAEEGSVLLRSMDTSVVVVSDVREKTFALTDECPFPASLGDEPRILTRRAEILTEDVQYVGGKILFRGRVRSELLLQDRETHRAAVLRCETEFSQLMEIDADSEDVQPELRLFLTGAYYDMPEPGRTGSIQTELHIGAQCVCRERRAISYISDLYSNRTELIPERVSIPVIQGSDRVVLRQTVAERLDGAERDAELLQTAAVVGPLTQEAGAVRTNVTVRLLYRMQNGAYSAAQGRLSAEFTLPDASSGETLRDASVTVTDVYCVPGTGDVRVSLRLDAAVEKDAVISCVSAVREDAEAWQSRDRAPSAVMLRVPEGSDLWDIAKRCHSTVEDILAVNEGRSAGLLLVPKGR